MSRANVILDEVMSNLNGIENNEARLATLQGTLTYMIMNAKVSNVGRLGILEAIKADIFERRKHEK